MVSIAVDAMGGDDAPRAIVEGVALGFVNEPNAEIVLVVGNERDSGSDATARSLTMRGIGSVL